MEQIVLKDDARHVGAHTIDAFVESLGSQCRRSLRHLKMYNAISRNNEHPLEAAGPAVTNDVLARCCDSNHSRATRAVITAASVARGCLDPNSISSSILCGCAEIHVSVIAPSHQIPQGLQPQVII